MSTLSVRYRPQTIEDVWGNEGAKTTLRNLLGKKERPQVYLFTGTQGCGKTTLARSFAKDLGAEDIEEYNMSDHTGVDFARSLIEEVGYTFADVKVYILDEVQMLSQSAMSSLLKVLEEPPKDVYFMLCTTNPEKLTPAFKSRPVKIQVSPLDEDVLIKHLKKLCRAENIETTLDVLEMIADKSGCVPRDAILMLEEVSGLEEEKAFEVLKNHISAGTISNPDVKEICQTLYKGGSWKSIAKNLKNIKGSDAEGVRQMIAGYFTAIILNSEYGDNKAAAILQNFTESVIYTGFPALVLQCFGTYNELHKK